MSAQIPTLLYLYHPHMNLFRAYSRGCSSRFPLGAVLIALTLCACQTEHSRIPASASDDGGVLVPGDVLRFTFAGEATMNQTQRIRPDGRVNLPDAGDIVAAGKHLASLQRELSQLYKSHLANNDVSIALETSGRTVSITGAVLRPAELPLDRRLTLYEAIEKAGGFSNLANDHKVIVVRTSNGHHYSQTFDLSGARKGREIPVFYLRANDTITVPERFF